MKLNIWHLSASCRTAMWRVLDFMIVAIFFFILVLPAPSSYITLQIHPSRTTFKGTRSLSHQLCTTQICHTQSVTHIFVTHAHTIFGTQHYHMPSFTYIFITRCLQHTCLDISFRHFSVASGALLTDGWVWWSAGECSGRELQRAARGVSHLPIDKLHLSFVWRAWPFLQAVHGRRSHGGDQSKQNNCVCTWRFEN